MTDYKMTDEWRKKLTEFLGECWHEWELIGSGNHKCKYCGYISFRDFFPSNRTFTTDKDMLAVFRKIRDKGKWAIFYSRTMQIWYSEEEQDLESNLEDYGYEACFSRWLFLDNPEQACCLAAMFLEEQG